MLHDATEAYVGDVTTPLKQLLPKFNQIEKKLERQIAESLNVYWDADIRAKVKYADMVALSTEAHKFFGDVSDWDSIKPYPPRPDLMRARQLTPEQAKHEFITEFCRSTEEI